MCDGRRRHHPDLPAGSRVSERTATVWQGHLRCAPSGHGRALGRYVERHTGISKQLLLDLRAVDFCGTQAFTALYYISVHCARSDVDWMIIGSLRSLNKPGW
jgi:hypothetical protein